VTIRAFRAVFAGPLAEAGFIGAVAPFIPANPGLRMNDRLLADLAPVDGSIPVRPQVITRDPDSLRVFLRGLKDRGFTTCDLNAGCPFPMIVRRGRGSGLFRTPDVLERLIAVGCEELGPGNFSVKTRLGLARADELDALLPLYNRYPLAFLTVHARTARQMYEGTCDLSAFDRMRAASENRVYANGDLPLPVGGAFSASVPEADGYMVGRSFIRALGARDDVRELLRAYIDVSRTELCGDNPVLGRVKELVSYWTETPYGRRVWPLVKICRSVDELLCVC